MLCAGDEGVARSRRDGGEHDGRDELRAREAAAVPESTRGVEAPPPGPLPPPHALPHPVQPPRHLLRAPPEAAGLGARLLHLHHRAGLRRGHAQTRVHVHQQLESPGTRRPDTEHLDAAPGVQRRHAL